MRIPSRRAKNDGNRERGICLVVSSLARPGGAERVVVHLGNYWVKRGRRVTLLTLDAPGTEPFYELDERIRLHNLDLLSASGHIFRAFRENAGRIRKIRAALLEIRPRVVISFVHSMNTLTVLATRGLGIPVVVSERSVPGVEPRPVVWAVLTKLAYMLADRVVAQTDQARKELELGAKVTVIPNPIPEKEPAVSRTGERKRLVAVGRLGKEKGFDLLIEAFGAILEGFPDWDLFIYGEGSERRELEAAIVEAGCAARVFLPGTVADIDSKLREADLFVLSSRYEGFPNALCEAMAVGLAVLATDCPFGPAEIIENGVNGLLVPAGDRDGLAAGLRRLMADARERGRLGVRAREISRRFSIDAVARSWETLIDELSGGDARS